eukprot:TRINITY_DN102790_c0_g1_i1.p1 TRINITY_DN102790_c0_g1~~TRINITY_DN102790_c0_g1_i1.p1  ORF type:complete len:339 (-),score=48.46 TRINITY_DN102790_c0_g1_i1:171-1187(-)
MVGNCSSRIRNRSQRTGGGCIFLGVLMVAAMLRPTYLTARVGLRSLAHPCSSTAAKDGSAGERVLRIAAFADGKLGGNPAGVAIRSQMPEESDMRRVASEVGFSETVFAVRSGDSWRVRYFSPETEVPFCGHATIALGAALAMQEGDGVFSLQLNAANITVQGLRDGDTFQGALQSPSTQSYSADAKLVLGALHLFGYSEHQLDKRIPPCIAEGGNRHLVLALEQQASLVAMSYDLESGRKLMNEAGLVTIILVHAVDDQHFHVRNAFASGGVYEDPATGSAAAAFAGYLRDLGWPHAGRIELTQGSEMGMPSRLFADIPPESGSSIRVTGAARLIEE